MWKKSTRFGICFRERPGALRRKFIVGDQTKLGGKIN